MRAGWDQKNSRRLGVINAQFGACNASRHPGMAHCVAEETRSYWRSFQNSPVNQGCEGPRSDPFLSRSVSLRIWGWACADHWWHNAESYFLIGKAMGAGMLKAMQG